MDADDRMSALRAAHRAQSLPGIGEEAQRVVSHATDGGEVLRVTGSVAFALRGTSRAGLPRPAPVDIDLVAPAKSERRIAKLLADMGYTPEKEFNARHGDRRLIFWDEPRERKLEVFVGVFVMCHSLPLGARERLELEPETVPAAELLLTKLQIVELNEKDMSDMHALLLTHDVGDGDAHDRINAARVAALCAADWGLHRTVTRTLERLAADPPSYTLSGDQRRLVDARLAELRRALDARPKSIAWRMRARIGDRVRWYEEPEEI
jgi:hypothetical protein